MSQYNAPILVFVEYMQLIVTLSINSHIYRDTIRKAAMRLTYTHRVSSFVKRFSQFYYVDLQFLLTKIRFVSSYYSDEINQQTNHIALRRLFWFSLFRDTSEEFWGAQ